MSTIAEMMIEIGADTTDLDRATRQMQNDMRGVGGTVAALADDMGTSTSDMRRQWRQMSEQMRQAVRQSQAALAPFRAQQQEIQYEFFQMAQGMSEYQGSTEDFMSELTALGNRNRSVNDQMMANNNMARMGFIQGVATMLAASTQSSKIAANFTRMNNPLYRVNNGLLQISGGLERLASRGQPAVLALRMLGPTASMKQLNDMTMLITNGLMRFQAVALAAAVASVVLYTSLFKAAKGPDPSEVYAKQTEALANYENEVKTRTQAIMNAWSLFDNIKLTNTTGKQLIKNLQEQVTTLGNWKNNIANIAKRAGSDFAAYLSDMGPQSAGEISAISKMSGPQLQKYANLWRDKMKLSKDQAMWELRGLKAETDKVIKDLQNSLTPLGLALEPMKQAWAGAFKPMIAVFTAVMVPIVNVITKVGQLINKFNEAHPTIAKIIQGFLMLIPALALILSPLAIGIGLFGGLQAAWASLAPFVMPLVTGLASMMGTVLLVAAAVSILIGGIMHLWKTNETFRSSIQGLIAKFMEFVGVIGAAVTPLIGKLANTFSTVGKAITAAFSGDLGPLMGIVQNLIPSIIAMLIGGIPGLIITAARFIPAISGGILSNAANLSATITNIVTSITTFLTTQLPVFIQMGITILQNLINGVTQTLPVLVFALVNIVQQIVPLITSLLPVLLQAGIMILQAVINGVITLLPVLLQTGLTIIMSLVTLIAANLPYILNAGIQILMALVNGIIGMLPQLINTALTLISMVANMLIRNLPKIIAAGVQILISLVNGIVKMLPTLITMAITLILKVATTLLNNLPKIIDAGVKLLMALINGITKILPQLIGLALKLIVSVSTALISALPQIISAGVKLVLALIKGILQLAGQLGSAIKNDIIPKIVDTLKGIDLIGTGKNIIQGLINGISSMAGAVWQEIKDVAGGIKDKIKDALGIKSPSRWMRDMIGKNIVLGMAIGIDAESGTVMDSLGRLTDDIQGQAQLDLNAPSMPTFSNSAISRQQKTDPVYIIELDGRQIAKGTLPHITDIVRLKTGIKFN
jgi:phage-related protein